MSTPFYDLASLVVVPSGYKASKVYAQKPLTTDGQLTFTRASNATRVASNGLIEKVRTNLALYSQNFSQTGTWVTSTTTRVDSQTDPNGGTTASKFTATGANSNVIQTISVSSGVAYTWSFWAKSDSATSVNIRLDNNNGNFAQANMALTTSWQRFSITLNSNNTSISCYLGGGLSFTTGEIAYIAFAQLEASDIATQYIATTTAAVSVGPVSGLPRLDYLNSTCPRLLLEPAATALNQFSESFDNAYWIKNDVTVTSNTSETLDPSGYYGADKIVETATTARHRVASGSLNLTAVNHTSSVFMKKGTARYGFVAFSGAAVSSIVVDLDNGTITSSSTSGTIVAQKVESYGNGWYRISITALGTSSSGVTYSLQYGTAGSATPTFTSNIPSHAGSTANHIYAWGANLTATSYPQSYIPTLSTSVTRVADAASKTGISSLIGQTEGTVFLDLEISAIASRALFSIDIGTTTNYIAATTSATNQVRVFVSQAGSGTVIITSSALTFGRHKLAIGYKSGDYVLYIDGVQAGASASTLYPVGALIQFVLNNASYGSLSDGYNQALIFKTRLTNAQLAELTTL